MGTNRGFKIVVFLLFTLPLVSMSVKIKPIVECYNDFNPEKIYKVSYHFKYASLDKNTNVKSFLPVSNQHQRIFDEKNYSPNIIFTTHNKNDDLEGIWITKNKNTFFNIKYDFIYEGRAVEYKIDPKILKKQLFSAKDSCYLKEEKHIQVFHPKIDSLAKSLTKDTKYLDESVAKIYNYVRQIPSIETSKLTDALTTLTQNKASCNGKSRLFVALCRNSGIAARVKGGIILGNVTKKTSHSWVEVLIQNTWIPFDALNGYYAKIPANYLELYTGDLPLISHSAQIPFEYVYEIKQKKTSPFLNESYKNGMINYPITLWRLKGLDGFTERAIHLLLIFPLGGLVVIIYRNVVGFKTLGAFMPVLIALTFLDTGYFFGLLFFILFILFLSATSLLLDKFGLLYIPKVVILLTTLLTVVVLVVYIGAYFSIPWLVKVSMFPFIIVAFSTERFATSLVEDGYRSTFKTLYHTLIVTTTCYLVFDSGIWKTVVVFFPETVFLIIGFSLLLGKWIGMRLSEYKRFGLILK